MTSTLEKYLPKTTAKNILAVILGLIIGGIINSKLIQYGPSIISPPEGVDPMDMKSIKANAHLYEWSHFIMTFVAHAVGTLVGAFVAAKVAAYNQKRMAMIIGIFFLLGGITMAILLPDFWKFSIVDIIFAYIPMALLGWTLAGRPNDGR